MAVKQVWSVVCGDPGEDTTLSLHFTYEGASKRIIEALLERSHDNGLKLRVVPRLILD